MQTHLQMGGDPLNTSQALKSSPHWQIMMHIPSEPAVGIITTCQQPLALTVVTLTLSFPLFYLYKIFFSPFKWYLLHLRFHRRVVTWSNICRRLFSILAFVSVHCFSFKDALNSFKYILHFLRTLTYNYETKEAASTSVFLFFHFESKSQTVVTSLLKKLKCCVKNIVGR